jgi:hypothetical protein
LRHRIVEAVIEDHDIRTPSSLELFFEQDQLLIRDVSFNSEIGDERAILPPSVQFT